MANKPFSFDLVQFAADVRTAVRRVYVITSPEAYARQIPEADFNRHLPRDEQGHTHEAARRQFTTQTALWQIHPAVVKAWELAAPINHHQLALEWPHRSESDPSRLAYTKDWRGWATNKQLITTVGKYLTRHFPSLADHQIRDIVALTAETHEMAITYDVNEFVHIANEGPDSCMNWSGDGRDHWVHPYRAYDPKYGWGIAYRKTDGSIDGRCIINDNNKTFVRSFKRGSGYSHSDETLEAWLSEHGYSKAYSWQGLCLAVVPDEYRSLPFVAPYLDGEVQRASLIHRTDGDALIIDSDGDLDFTHTDGTHDEVECYTCDDCGATVSDEDDLVHTYHGDSVCRDCVDTSYVSAVVSGGYRDIVGQGEAIYAECHDEWYHEDVASDYVVYSDSDGDYIDREDAVYVNGDWYRSDDENIVLCADDEYRLVEDCVQCDDYEWRPADECVECYDGAWRPADECVECYDGEWRPKDECIEVRKPNPFGTTLWASEDDPNVVQLPSGDYYFMHDTVYDAENDVYVVPFTYDTHEYAPTSSRTPLSTSLIAAHTAH